MVVRLADEGAVQIPSPLLYTQAGKAKKQVNATWDITEVQRLQGRINIGWIKHVNELNSKDNQTRTDQIQRLRMEQTYLKCRDTRDII